MKEQLNSLSLGEESDDWPCCTKKLAKYDYKSSYNRDAQSRISRGKEIL